MNAEGDVVTFGGSKREYRVKLGPGADKILAAAAADADAKGNLPLCELEHNHCEISNNLIGFPLIHRATDRIEEANKPRR